MTQAETIQELRDALEKQDDFIKKLMEQSAPYATVAYVGTDRVVLSAGGGSLMEVALPPDLDLAAGDCVAIAQQTGQIVKKGMVSALGESCEVKAVKSKTNAEVEVTGGRVVTVFKSPVLELEEGDRVALDTTGMVIMIKLEGAAKKYVKKSTGVTWADIGGLEDVKRELIEAIELPSQEPEYFKFYGYSPPKGLLLSGPPGNGKTMLGKAAATAIANIYGGESGFIYVKGPEILNKYVGESESKIRAIFDQARAHKAKHGAPAIVFIDEAEAILSRRGSGLVSDMEKTIVPAFLAEMDGLEETAAIVMLATNRPDQLDPAVVRDGRIDRKIKVGRPGQEGISAIAAINLRDVPLCDGTTKEMADLVTSELLDPRRKYYTVHLEGGDQHPVILADLVSGAMVANVIGRAKSLALKRDLASRKMTGVSRSDLVAAVDLIASESSNIDPDVVIDALGGRKPLHISKPQAMAA